MEIKISETSLLHRACEIAREAHAGQYDKAGEEYIKHPLRVMEMGHSEEEKITGVLHDVVEDSDWTFEMLEAEGFSPEVISALRCLTKLSDDEDYDDFISRVLTNHLAMKVKVNDLKDNMTMGRLKTIGEHDLRRMEKYMKALERIKEHSPFAIVREETWTEYRNGYKFVYTKSFDAQGRVVGVSDVHYHNDENVGHFAEYVEIDGYWHGGFYDAQTGIGGQTFHEFIEGEVF